MFVNLEFFLNIFLSVALIAIFICVFFFTYAKNVEEQIVIKQTQELVYDLMGDVLKFEPVKNSLKEVVPNLKSPDMSREDKKVERDNQLLLNQALSLIIISSVVVFTIVFSLVYIFNLSFVKIIVPNIIILGFVGLVEFLFLRYIAFNYISFDPNYAKHAVLQTLQDYAYNR